MRLKCTLLAMFALVLFSSNTVTGQGVWSIANFDVQLVVAPDGMVEVTETIEANFRDFKHGIYREIPIHYAVGAHQYSLRFRLLEVTDGVGKSRKKKVSYQSNMVRIRIGDPDVRDTGGQIYRIRYKVARAILWEGDHAVLRWNATGTEWRVPIHQVTVTISLPRPLAPPELISNAWTGSYGARQRDATFTQVNDETIKFETQTLRPGEGITIDVAMPNDAVTRPGWLKVFGWWLGDNFVYGIFFAMLGVCLLSWSFLGRDRPGHGTIVVQYKPPNALTPAEVGTLIDERVDLRDISATIIDLAVRGYLKIEEIDSGVDDSKPDFQLLKFNKDEDDLKPFEQSIMNKIFGSQHVVLLSDLKENFYTELPKIRQRLYRSLTQTRFFDGDPSTVRTKFAIFGVGVLILALLIAIVIQIWMVGRVFWIPIVITGVLSLPIVLLTSRYMPRKTRKGRIAWEQITGLEEYIRRAEVDDIKSQEKQGVFERLLPYAIVFGLADRWAKAFEGLYSAPPDWYRPANTSHFTTAWLVSSMNRSVDSMNQTLPSQPRSTGTGGGGGGGWSSGGFSGGSVGGGFGGGGGGGW